MAPQTLFDSTKEALTDVLRSIGEGKIQLPDFQREWIWDDDHIRSLEVIAWVDGGPEPSTVADSNFAPNRLLTLCTRNSAAYKGLYVLLLRDGCLDFLTGESIEVQTYFEDKIDVHHVFPREWFRQNKFDKLGSWVVMRQAPTSRASKKMVFQKIAFGEY